MFETNIRRSGRAVMDLNQRQIEIIRLFKEKNACGVKELVRTFHVSEMTIRRDLALLEKNGSITRTHGGGIDTQKISFDFLMGEKAGINVDAKKAIAAKAAAFIRNGDTVILDTGSTVLQLSNELGGFDDLTVVTPSLAVAANLFRSKTVKLIILGGYVKPQSPDLVGVLTEKNIRELHFKTAFLGADGIDPAEGFFCSDINYGNVVREMIKASEQVIVLADASKIGKKALTRYGDFSDVDLLITDLDDADTLASLRKKVKTVSVPK
jgi:DeoR/GlpR family transcriptional regulator of sugar metabolism